MGAVGSHTALAATRICGIAEVRPDWRGQSPPSLSPDAGRARARSWAKAGAPQPPTRPITTTHVLAAFARATVSSDEPQWLLPSLPGSVRLARRSTEAGSRSAGNMPLVCGTANRRPKLRRTNLHEIAARPRGEPPNPDSPCGRPNAISRWPSSAVNVDAVST